MTSAMDWWNVLELVLGTSAATGLVSAVGASLAFRSKVDRLEASTEQRVKDWEKWRVELETRLNARADHLAAHEKECRERWEKLLVEHGGIIERLRSIDQQLQYRRRRS